MGAFTMRLKAMVLAGATIGGECLVARSISTSPTSRSRRFRSFWKHHRSSFLSGCGSVSTTVYR